MAKCPFSFGLARPIGSSSNSSSSSSLTEHYSINSATTDAASSHSGPPSTASSSSSDQSFCSTSADCFDDSSNISSSSRGYVHQAWQLKRPVLQHDPKLTRRQLRRLNKSWTLEEVSKHKYCDDGWIAVEGKVYDITEHIATHPGWDSGCQVTTVLSIIAHLGTDCTQEFRDIHASYPVAWSQLRAFFIGDLASSSFTS